jgi:hypothetical protein
MQATSSTFRLFSSEVASPRDVLPPGKHRMEHVIENSSCQVDDEKLVAAKLKFLKLEQESYIQQSSSCQANPLHVVKKSDGTWQLSGQVLSPPESVHHSGSDTGLAPRRPKDSHYDSFWLAGIQASDIFWPPHCRPVLPELIAWKD